MYRLILVLGLLMLSSAGVIAGPTDPDNPPTEKKARGSDTYESSIPGNLKGQIVVYKFKITDGTAWQNGIRGSWVIYDVVNGESVIIKHTTLHVNQWTGYSKWWDHDVIASRACKQTKDGGEDLSNCIVGNGNLVKLPDGESVYNYKFEFSWNENGQVQSAKMAIDPKEQPTNVRSME
jgi:hypothetical protein